MVERLSKEIKRRTRVVGTFSNEASCLLLIRALCAETHETRLEDRRYRNMAFRAEQRRAQLRLAAWFRLPLVALQGSFAALALNSGE